MPLPSPASSGLRPIGKLAAATGVKVPTIRFYEEIGLLPPPPRTASDRRMYDDAAERRLSFIRHARQLGFDLDSIRSLLDLSDHPDRPCAEASTLAERHLADVKQKIARLRALQRELSRMTTECAGGPGLRLQGDRGVARSIRAALTLWKIRKAQRPRSH